MSLIQIGDTFVIKHLWIVISDPAKHSGRFVIVNLTSNRDRAGAECELNPGDHEWIDHKSYASFGDAREVGPREAREIVTHMIDGSITKHFPMKVAVLHKIIQAAKKSKALPTGLRAYL